MFANFNIFRFIHGNSAIDFTTAKAANSDSAYWNGR